MKCEIVTKLTLDGKYEILYIGPDRGEARKVYKENMIKKDEFQSLWQHSMPVSRTISKAGHIARAEEKAESDSEKEKEQAVVKAGLVFDAMTDDKITMHEAKNLIAKPVADVEEALKEVEANATGRGKTEEPKEEPKASKYEEYCALSGNEKTSFFAQHKDEIIEDMKKEK